MYNSSPISWLLWAGCLIIGILCLRPLKQGPTSLRWVNPRMAFGFAFLLLHVVRPFYLLLTGDYYGARLGLYGFWTPEEITPMLLASMIGGVSFSLGWRWGMRRVGLAPTSLEVELGERKTPSQSAAPFVARAFLLLPIAGMAFVIGRSGPVSTEAINIYYLLRSALIPVTYLLVVGGIYSRNRGLFLLAAIAALSYLWLFSREIGTSRLFLLMFLMPGLILLAVLLRRKAVGLVSVLVVLSVFTFMFLSNSRYALREGASVTEQLEIQMSEGTETITSYILRGGDFEAFEKGMLIMQLIPSYDPPYLGSSFATLFVMPIPRMLWPDKPAVSPTDTIVKWYPKTPDNFAITLIGEAYANGLWPGIIVVLFAFGLVSAWVFKRRIAQPSDVEGLVWMGLYMAYAILVTRGSFHTMTSYFLFSLFWFAASKWIIGLFQHRKPVARLTEV